MYWYNWAYWCSGFNYITYPYWKGGCCLTNDKNLAERLQLLRNHEAVIENDIKKIH